MSSVMKRKLNSASRSVSPPPIRRCFANARVVDSPSLQRDDLAMKACDNLTIYSWNVNGIGPLLQKQITFSANLNYPLRGFLKSHHWPHLLCLQEVKIHRDDQSTRRRVELAANAGARLDEPTYTTHFSLPRDRFNATGFGGKVHGVATLIRDEAPTSTIRTSRPDWDLEGRVLIHEFDDLPLVVINGYWVNGTDNPYHNTTTGKVEGSRHDHKLRFHAHILDLCKSIEATGKSVLLLGDMNIARSRIDGHPNLRKSPVQHVRNRADFNAKFFDAEQNGLEGIDVFRHIHGDRRKYTYHGRGRPWGESCDRVDMIIASRQLVCTSRAITGTDICDTPQERGHSDHVPLWVSLDPAKISGSQTKENASQRSNDGRV